MEEKDTIITNLFIAIRSNDFNYLEELLKEHPLLVSATMPLNYLVKVHEWLAIYHKRKDADIPEYIKTAIKIYLTWTLIDWSIQSKSFESFKLLLTLGSPFGENAYCDAIRELETNNDDRWLKVLLENKKNDIPFNALSYSLANSGIKSFYLLRSFGGNIYGTDIGNVLKDNMQFEYGLLGVAHTMEQVMILIDLHVPLHSGDFIFRLQNICMDLEIFGFLLKKFTEEFQYSRKMLELFDIKNGRFVINKVVADLVNSLMWHIVGKKVWKKTLHTYIDNALIDKFPSLQILAFNSLKNNSKSFLCDGIF